MTLDRSGKNSEATLVTIQRRKNFTGVKMPKTIACNSNQFKTCRGRVELSAQKEAVQSLPRMPRHCFELMSHIVAFSVLAVWHEETSLVSLRLITVLVPKHVVNTVGGITHALLNLFLNKDFNLTHYLTDRALRTAQSERLKRAYHQGPPNLPKIDVGWVNIWA